MRYSKLSFVTILLGFHVAVGVGANEGIAKESEPELSTLDRISKLGVDALLRPALTYYTQGFEGRSAGLSQMCSDASKFFSKQLEVSETLRLAVLDEGHWNRVAERPYGAPWLSPDRPYIVVMPATTKRGVVVDALGEFLDRKMIQPTVDYIGLHNVARLYVRRYLYPEDFEGEPSIRWFEELMASYLASAFLGDDRSALSVHWDQVAERVLERPPPESTSLANFEKEYGGALAPLEKLSRFVWYQSAFSQMARELHENQGLELIQRLKAELPWDTFDSWESDQLLGWLEPIAPEIPAWATELSSERR